MRLIAIVAFVLFAGMVDAQDNRIDSLKQLLQDHTSLDTVRVNLLNETASALFKVNADTALLYATQAKELAAQLGHTRGEAEGLKNMAFYYLRTGDYEKSKQLYNAALELYIKINDFSRVALCYNNIGVIYKIQSEFEKTLEYNQKALEIRKKIDDKYGIASSLTNIGVAYYNQGEYDKSIEYFIETLKVSEEIGNEGLIIKNNNNIGGIYQEQGDYPKALEYYQKSLSSAEKASDEVQVCSAQINIGNIYYFQKEYTKALEYYNKALEVSRQNDDKQHIAQSLNNIGIIYEEQEMYETALPYYTEAIDINKSIGNKKDLAQHFNNVGSLYLRMNNFEKAKEYFSQSLNMGIEIGSKPAISASQSKLANVYLRENDAKTAYNYAKQAFEISDEIGDALLQKEAAEMLAKSSKALGKYKEAYYAHVVFKTLSDSLFNENNIKQITNLENQYQFDKEKQQIAAEEARKDAIQEAELKRQKQLSYAAIVGTAIFLILSVIIFRNLVQKRRANRMLAEQKEEIQTQAEELKTINDKLVELDDFKQNMTGMIVHDLKNSLNAIINVSKKDNSKRQVQKNINTATQMLNMVQNILDVQKFEDTNFEPDTKPANLLSVCRAAINQTEFLAEEKNITIQNNIAENIGVEIDTELIERVFINLLTNAIKFSPTNETIEIETKHIGNRYKIMVTNKGKGIAEKDISRIFDKFGQSEAVSSGGVRSTGLGLTFCKYAIEAHNSEIGVVSAQNKNTTFWFELPAAKKVVAIENRVPTEIKENKWQLTKEELTELKSIATEISKFKIYEVSAITKILSEYKPTTEKSKLWVEKVRQTIYNSNEEYYRELLDVV